MTLITHGDRKYGTGDEPVRMAEWNGLRVEQRWVGPGRQNCVRPECTEIVHILSGRAKVRRKGDGQLQEGIAGPGTSWLVPAGTHETLLELDSGTDCLIVFLPDTLLERSALADYGIDPASVRLAYAGGVADRALADIGRTLHAMLDGPSEPSNRILADATRTALAARLIGDYSVDRWRCPAKGQALEPKRLKRVLDRIEAGLGEDLSLDELAAEACLSPFHFARLFQEATGSTPHRYVTARRIRAAQALLAEGRLPLAEIALDTGFGSQGSFTRVFRKITGTTPGQYRAVHRR